jgi:hypothetical protein
MSHHGAKAKGNDMTDIFIDLTQGKPKSYVTGRCFYCDHKHPNGKLIDPTIDKNAIRLKDGSWMCGVCNVEQIKNLLNMNKGGTIK